MIQQNMARESEAGNEKESWTVRSMSLSHLMPGSVSHINQQGCPSYLVGVKKSTVLVHLFLLGCSALKRLQEELLQYLLGY